MPVNSTTKIEKDFHSLAWHQLRGGWDKKDYLEKSAIISRIWDLIKGHLSNVGANATELDLAIDTLHSENATLRTELSAANVQIVELLEAIDIMAEKLTQEPQ